MGLNEGKKSMSVVSKPKKPAKRAVYETVYRVQWAAGDVDIPLLSQAYDKQAMLLSAGVTATVVSFLREKR